MHLMAIHIPQMVALHGNVKQFSCQGECVFKNYTHTCNLHYQGVYELRLVLQPHYIYWVGGNIYITCRPVAKKSGGDDQFIGLWVEGGGGEGGRR